MNEQSTNLNYSKLREENRVDLVRASPIAAPMAIYIETTNICNFRCVYCPESFPDFAERSGGLHKMDVGSFASIAKQIKDLGKLKVLNFYMMGEPFANPSLCKFISHATELQTAERTCVTTNGTLLRDTVIDDIRSMGLDYLRVSIYGGTPESFARRTASTFPLQRIVENVKNLRNQRDTLGLTKPHIYVKMIDTLDAEENAAFFHFSRTSLTKSFWNRQ